MGLAKKPSTEDCGKTTNIQHQLSWIGVHALLLLGSGFDTHCFRGALHKEVHELGLDVLHILQQHVSLALALCKITLLLSILHVLVRGIS